MDEVQQMRRDDENTASQLHVMLLTWATSSALEPSFAAGRHWDGPSVGAPIASSYRT